MLLPWGTRWAQSLRDTSPPVLFFVPVGKQRLETMRDNVLALSISYPHLEYFFAHYDGTEGRDAYLKEEWYRKHVGEHSVAYPGSKPQFVFDVLTKDMRLVDDPWLRRFRFFWFADDNVRDE